MGLGLGKARMQCRRDEGDAAGLIQVKGGTGRKAGFGLEATFVQSTPRAVHRRTWASQWALACRIDPQQHRIVSRLAGYHRAFLR